MPRIELTKALRRHVDCPAEHVLGSTVGEALQAYFALHPPVRGYVLDEQGMVRKHVTVFVNGEQVLDRAMLADPVGPNDEVHVFQALSGG